MQPENCQLKSTLLDYGTDRFVCAEYIFKKAEDCTPQKCKTYFVLIKFFVSEYDLFRFPLSFSTCFWTVFVKPSAAPPVHAKISGSKLLCSTSRILFSYLNVLIHWYSDLTLMIILVVRYSLGQDLAWGLIIFYIREGVESGSV